MLLYVDDTDWLLSEQKTFNNQLIKWMFIVSIGN